MAYLLKKHKAVYWDIPKNASTSLKDFFSNESEPYTEGRQECLHFAFVRHPFHRLYSLYKNFILSEPVNNESFINGVEKVVLHRYGVFYAGMPFKEFALKVILIPIKDADPHFMPQWMLIPGANICISKLEDFETEWKKLSKVLNIKGTPKVTNKSDSGDWEGAYTKELKNIVGKHYELDFTFYGYKA